ncbi:hypothetical protein BZA05DRAFT_30164 [Tricharina praecox]|uniref:uncharacterized protein n=1 Tax=Tricharina praecox TaxID=43433 RepID=UPI002220E9EE|nr:uncharacterized protein BZA05DRAFT_30164 [Tricharina praecox]KAI5853456.1 hypothetical protein BZA05DRAFT_30164 [Tricharina praecox]
MRVAAGRRRMRRGALLTTCFAGSSTLESFSLRQLRPLMIARRDVFRAGCWGWGGGPIGEREERVGGEKEDGETVLRLDTTRMFSMHLLPFLLLWLGFCYRQDLSC